MFGFPGGRASVTSPSGARRTVGVHNDLRPCGRHANSCGLVVQEPANRREQFGFLPEARHVLPFREERKKLVRALVEHESAAGGNMEGTARNLIA